MAGRAARNAHTGIFPSDTTEPIVGRVSGTPAVVRLSKDLTEARGDPLIAVGLAVAARATIRRRQALGGRR